MDKALLTLCVKEAVLSPDPSTQFGCVLVDASGRVIGLGHNTFPRGTKAHFDKPLKYSLIEHAERNAVYSAARWGCAINHSTAYCLATPCCDCVRAFVQSGVKRVVYLGLYDALIEGHSTWRDSCKIGRDILQGANVECVPYRETLNTGLSVLFNGTPIPV